MTQQSLSQLPSISLVDLISPSSFHPGVLHGDEIWHVSLGNREVAARGQVIGGREQGWGVGGGGCGPGKPVLLKGTRSLSL